MCSAKELSTTGSYWAFSKVNQSIWKYLQESRDQPEMCDPAPVDVLASVDVAEEKAGCLWGI